MEDEEEADLRTKADLIREKKALMINEAKLRKSLKNRAVIPRAKKARTVAQMQKHMTSIGLDASAPISRARAQFRNDPPAPPSTNGEAMDIDPTPSARLRSISRAPKTNRLTDGLQMKSASRTGIADPAKMREEKTTRMAKLSQRKRNRMARQGEADRHTTSAMPKHLFAGKRGIGKASHR